MMRSIFQRVGVVAAAAILVSAPVGAAGGDAKAGKEKAASCAACHGEDGNSPNAQFPKLAGQHADYLAAALLQYQTGERQNPIMVGLAKPLSDADRADLAAYFASLPGDLVTLDLE